MSATAPAPDRPRGVGRVLRDTGYNLSAFLISLIAFVVVVVGLALGAGLLVLGIGLAVLAGTALAARGFAQVERIRLRTMLGKDVPLPSYAVAASDAGPVRRVLTVLRDPQSWLDLLWSVVGLATGIAAFVVTVVWWALTVGGLTYWYWQQWIPESDGDQGLAELLGFGDGRAAESLLNLAIGVLALLTLPAMMRLAAAVHGGLATVLLCSRAELQRTVQRVEGGREAARAAEAESLRRLERDIHDGPQQRLVRLSMDLARARRQVDHDPAQVAATLDAALEQTRETVTELRSLSRGIAPPLLVDRGLIPALQELTNLSAVPVTASVDVPAGLPPHVETCVYFVVAEALTNVNKHSRSDRATVQIRTDEDQIVVAVADDGCGGAHPAKGSGLAGLQQRILGVDGGLEVSSPEGGPTVIGAWVPWR